jgi:aminoglycoside/choline kinase family phosphotransferase
MLMDAPPPREDVRPFLHMARLLQGLDYSAPTILATDVEAGLLLLEDLGERTFTRLLDQGHDETALYGLAVDLLIDLHRRFDPGIAHGLMPYDETRLVNEAALLVDWYLPAVSGAPTGPDLRQSYLDLWRDLIGSMPMLGSSLVLRDYHVDNLIQLPDRTGLGACGLLDFQDAVIGPKAYDLVSLLEDARRDVSPPVAATMRARYVAAFPDLDRDAFDLHYGLLGAQRNAKIIGIFTRLAERDGKPAYLRHIPRVWRLIEGDLRHPALQDLARWFDQNIPAPMRKIPPCRTIS